ncbi:hypothetical protein GCM10023188_12290 [Pontibacter saemangeumensis]|uniref:Glycosyltransferase 2-like domain-containing protein n=1 Tax=Pontibacter saemangeumensis TaxID=1084525 RepID=A0ABP8LEM3_9BACT
MHPLEGGYGLHKSESDGDQAILVSIITIVFNGEKYLEHTIKSVLAQSYKNIEYIIVDGGSTDSTVEIIRKYEKKIAFWRSEPDNGISDAFNKGIALASGEIIGILNADDWYEPDAVSQIISHYRYDSVLHGNKQYWNEDGSKGPKSKPNLAILPLEMSLNHPTVFVSRSLYKKHGTFDTRYKLAMDYHLLLRLYQKGVNFIYVNHIITNMRVGGVSADIVGCYREVLQVKNEVLGPKIGNKLYFYWTLLRYNTSRILAGTPLAFLNKFYRTHISSVKKQY